MIDEFLETALVLLFDHLPIGQIGVGFLHRVLGTARLAVCVERSSGYETSISAERCPAESIAAKARDAQDHSGRHLDELQGTFKRPWANERRQDKAKLRSETDPAPLSPVRAQFAALTVRAGFCWACLRLMKFHILIALHLGDVAGPATGSIDLMRLLGRRRSHARTVASVTLGSSQCPTGPL